MISSSEVVGRPLAALLANDGARVFSVDIDSIQEYTKRPSTETSPSDSSTNANARRRYHPHHVVHPSTKSLQECLSISDVVISAVPSASYKVPTGWLKDGCVCVNVASEKNFEKDAREKVSFFFFFKKKKLLYLCLYGLFYFLPYVFCFAVTYFILFLFFFLHLGIDIRPSCWEGNDLDVTSKSVSCDLFI